VIVVSLDTVVVVVAATSVTTMAVTDIVKVDSTETVGEVVVVLVTISVTIAVRQDSIHEQIVLITQFSCFLSWSNRGTNAGGFVGAGARGALVMDCCSVDGARSSIPKPFAAANTALCGCNWRGTGVGSTQAVTVVVVPTLSVTVFVPVVLVSVSMSSVKNVVVVPVVIETVGKVTVMVEVTMSVWVVVQG
jgi:hypothetical protein